MTDTALIALDWGTSSLRGFRLGASGEVLEARASDHGIQHLPEGGFEAAFAQITQGWGVAPLVACGMVGSAQGWAEVPYLRCPANLSQLAGSAGRVMTPAGEMLIAPGLLFAPEGGAPDVMRGEEIQISGAIAGDPARQDSCTLVLPGTHSKWTTVKGGVVTGFATHMTGELFAVLRGHSILGRLMSEGNDEAAFAMGVERAAQERAKGLTHLIFGARTMGLTSALPHEVLSDYLSGLLIGHEVASGLASHDGGLLLLAGSPALCARYESALRLLRGSRTDALIENPAPAGLLQFARDAGLLA